MAENSKIEWCTHTFNPWVGCTKVSPACDHCYAESWAKRTGQPQLWRGERRRTTVANWRKPLKWDAESERSGVRAKVFCASLADVFDNQVPGEWRADLFDLIRLTPFLDWLLLTKRPQNIAKMIERDVLLGKLPTNVWLGTTVENQEEADRRIPHLLAVTAAVRFLSCEPLLGPVDLTAIRRTNSEGFMRPLDGRFNRVDLVICGGESGGHAREMDPEWARKLRDDCLDSGTAFFMKQMTRKAKIPDDLMVRQFPRSDADG